MIAVLSGTISEKDLDLLRLFAETKGLEFSVVEIARATKMGRPLHPKHWEIVAAIGLGVSSRDVARLLHVAPSTVDAYKKRLEKTDGQHTTQGR